MSISKQPHLAELGQARYDAKRRLDQATADLKAAVLLAAEEEMPETLIAAEGQVDCMTVRDWLGKR